MKRIIYLVALFLGLYLSAEAQNLESKNWQFGVRAGIGGAYLYGDVSNADPIFNFHVGGTVNYAFTNHFYLESGLTFTRKGYYTEETSSTESNFLNTGISGKAEITTNLYYLQLPILASYRFTFNDKLGLNIQAGPYLAYGIAGKCKWETSGNVNVLGINVGGDEEGDYDSFDDGNFKNFDTGVRIAVGLQYKAFSFTVGDEIGVVNILDNDSDDNYYNYAYTCTFGYDF